jgi:hypothetical protein
MAFAVSTIISGIGLGVAALGTGYSIYNSEKASEAQSAAAQNQWQIAQIQAANVDTERQKLALTTKQQELQIDTNKSVIQQQQAADDIRQQAASLDATRRIRQAIRTGIVAAGTGLNAAANSGANEPGSSATRQSRANIAGQSDVNIQGINQNLDFGNRIYNINKNISQTYLNAQDQNKSFVQQSQALQSKTLDAQQQIYQLGGNASLDYASAASYQGQSALGQGLTSFGSFIGNNSGTIGKITDYFLGNNGGTDNYAMSSRPWGA